MPKRNGITKHAYRTFVLPAPILWFGAGPASGPRGSAVGDQDAVIANGRSQKRADRAVRSSGAAHGIAADLGTEAGARAVIARFPSVDILVNNLGIFELKPV
jgi:hypothetical protein